jgi:hypothetical protein
MILTNFIAQIRFPVPFNDPPFISAVATGFDQSLPDRFVFEVKSAKARSVVMSARRNDKGVSSFTPWTQVQNITKHLHAIIFHRVDFDFIMISSAGAQRQMDGSRVSC